MPPVSCVNDADVVLARKEYTMTVEELMTRDVVTVLPEATLKEVAELLRDRQISGIPVVVDHRLLGVVSETDIVAKERGKLAPKRLRREHDEKRTARTAGEAMTAPAVTIEPWRSAAGAAAIMLEHGVNRLPVVDDDGEIVGIVTRADLVRAFARTDQEIAREIHDEVLMRSFWLDTASMTLSVEGGEVLLEGQVDSQAVAETLPIAIERVPGVVSVEANLTWPELVL
jgi:CBS domain-containing protein